MTMVTSQRGVDDYLAAVREALGPAKAVEHAELLDELADHLAEAAGDSEGESIEQRLGTPEAYAADFLSSAGIEPEPPAMERSAVAHLWERARRAASAARTGAPPELEPAWWVVRAWGVVALLTSLTADNRDMFPFPRLFANDVLSLAALVGAVALSVRVGRWGGWSHGLLTIAGVLGLAVGIGDGNTDHAYYGPTGVDSGMYVDGRYVHNIWPFDLQGRPLEGVLLFDQDGHPIDVDAPPEVGQPQGSYPRQITTYDHDPVTGQQREVLVDPPFTSIPVLGGPQEEGVSTTQVLPPADVTTVPPGG